MNFSIKYCLNIVDICKKMLLFELYFKLKLLLTVQYRWDLYEHKTSSHRNNSHPTLAKELILPIRFLIDNYSLCMFSMCCWCNNFFIHHYISWRGLLFSTWEANLVNQVTQYTQTADSLNIEDYQSYYNSPHV